MEYIPPHLVADYCLRCLGDYKDGDRCHLMVGAWRGAPNLGIVICPHCRGPLDSLRSITLYKLDNPGGRPELRYYAPTGAATEDGYVRVNCLANGYCRIGMKRGHAEVWREEEIKQFGGPTTPFGYVRGSWMYASIDTLKQLGVDDSKIEAVVGVEYLDLSTPEPMLPARQLPH